MALSSTHVIISSRIGIDGSSFWIYFVRDIKRRQFSLSICVCFHVISSQIPDESIARIVLRVQHKSNLPHIFLFLPRWRFFPPTWIRCARMVEKVERGRSEERERGTARAETLAEPVNDPEVFRGWNGSSSRYTCDRRNGMWPRSRTLERIIAWTLGGAKVSGFFFAFSGNYVKRIGRGPLSSIVDTISPRELRLALARSRATQRYVILFSFSSFLYSSYW